MQVQVTVMHLDSSTSPSQVPMLVEEVELVEKGVQVVIGDKPTELPGVDRQCSVCGREFEKDTRAQQNLWTGFIQTACLVLKKPLTKYFVSKLAFNCRTHR